MDRRAKFGLCFVLLFSLFVLLAVTHIPGRSRPGKLVTTGITSVGRFSHTATLLENDRVLIAGGMERNGVWLDTAELYDPATGRFIPAGRMTARRAGAMAVLLPGGKVLIAGGSDGSGRSLATAEIYDPASNSFSPTGSMTTPRSHGIAVFLRKTGRVLIAGGAASGDNQELASAEMYDPASGRFTPTGSMHVARAVFNAVTLNDGRVLVTGGVSGGDYPNSNIEASAEIFDPATERFTTVAPMSVSRYKHGMALLPDGRAMIIGGQTGGAYGPRLATTEIFDPETGRFSRGPNMKFPRFKLLQGVVALKDGRILVAGGADQPEIYDPGTNSFVTVTGPALDGFFFSTATNLREGKVLLVDGYGRRPTAGAVRQAWVWEP